MFLIYLHPETKDQGQEEESAAYVYLNSLLMQVANIVRVQG
jgi:hypothetical protein